MEQRLCEATGRGETSTESWSYPVSSLGGREGSLDAKTRPRDGTGGDREILAADGAKLPDRYCQCEHPIYSDQL